MSIYDSIPMRLRQTYLTLHRTAQADFAEFGVTVDQYVLLSVLADEEGIIQSELSSRMASDGNTITAMLKRLEQKKLVQRKRCDSDGRARRVYLTRTGRTLYKKLLNRANHIHTQIDQALSASERKTLFSLLNRLREAVD